MSVKWSLHVSTMCFPSSGVNLGSSFPGQFLKNGWTKTNALSTVCSTAWDTHYIKKWAQSVHSSRRFSKIKVPYQMTPEERYTTFRAKIEHLNHRKWYTKYIYSESTLDGLFKTLIFQNTVQSFKATKRTVSTVTPAGVNLFWGLKRGQVYWPISLKRLNKNKRP